MRIPLTVLLPSLALIACTDVLPGGAKSSCDGFEGGTFDDERSYPVTQEELDAALDENGDLPEAACQELCKANHYYEEAILEIKTCDLDDSGNAAPAYTGDTGQAAGSITCSWTEEAICEGRAHACLQNHPQGTGPTVVAAWLARAAHAESASVKAFVSLGLELDALGAPSNLVQRCRKAAREEVSHARRMGDLAARHGGSPTQPTMVGTPQRTLLDLAIENAVEGCVRETWAAMVAHWQAKHAGDAQIRDAMARIAHDEAGHGDLAQSIHEWAMTQLGASDQRAVWQAREDAIASLLQGLDRDVDPELVTVAGVPDRASAVQLGYRMQQHVWAEALAA